ncbi:hypothetical protein HW555_005568 [Spodoptera exigua]|uniref:Uncharacterized protein n=1 Tax=Spodoptera exigua TaxID=7107 RepID=A0A835L7C3_SPOEX|nr:hypothetical protein HW555_005568 [Spodoptera exigua]
MLLTIMKSLTLEGETLGEKRRHFNKLVADAVASKRYELTPIDYTDSDIDNLLKIEIACKTRNVDYVIEVMKSKDMLFASTAIKKSTWLITDPQYANIINPEYLHTQLKPYMTTKAFNKLILHIRLNLKDESRVEAFYEHLKSTRNSEKWLQNCSIPFIENAISFIVPVWFYRRLLKKSAHFLTFDTYIDAYREERQAAYLMLKSRTADVLDILEDTTEFLMKKCPQRVFENIKMYRWAIDMSVIARYMNKNEIAAFLCKNASDMVFCHDHKILIHFIKNMPEEERVKFIQKSFIDRTEMLFDKNEISFIDSSFRYYQWYEFFPFEIAFPKMNNLIRKENLPMGVYTETENDFQLCWESIIIRKVLTDEPVPESIEEKCTFRSFKNISKTLNVEQKNKFITYILTYMTARTTSEGFASESDFRDTLNKMESVLILLKDFNKTLSDYPFITKKIQDLNKIRQVNKWFVDMSCLYNVNKSWRKYMFEDSLSLSLCEETCLNALKHKPQLLTRHDKQIYTLQTNDAVSLPRVLAKLRVYWPDSLAWHWSKAYMQHLNGPTGHKAIIKGLFMLLSQDQVIELAKRYAPKNFKINWCLTDRTKINIRINIAKHLHLARPLVPLETVLWYAKGDYVQYAMQSHIAIWSALSEVDMGKNLSKFYDAPVIVLKFALNQAFLKLKTNNVINIFLYIWKCTRSSLIKSIILNRTKYATQKAHDNEIIQNELWKLLNMFIKDLSSEDESADIYKQLTDFEIVPYEKQAEYYMKISRYLASLPDWQRYKDEILYFSPRHMKLLDEDFVLNLLLSPVENIFCSSNRLILECFSNFLLYGKSEEDQLEILRKVEPAFDKVFQNWNKTNASKKNFESFLDIASLLFKNGNWYGMSMLIPAKLFAEIEFKMKNGLSLLENYKLFTTWKLITAYIKIFKLCEERRETGDKDYDRDFSPLLSSIILEYLKDDVEEYGPMIHDMFAAALDKMCKMLFIHNYLIIEMLRHMLNDEGFVPACLVVSKILPKSVHEETKHAQSEIFQKLKSNEDTFGEKRRKFNKLVADAVASKHYELTPITDTDSDINNLLKIEIACKTRNVDYVIEVMKSKDMLYTSTAIKKSTWLITDPQYANIINPEYLHTQLKPYMTTKAFNKLMLHIRLNLKDQSRVESFFEYFRETDGACKWLQNCSIPFIENVIKKRPVPAWLFKRLCKRSARFLGLYAYVEPYEGKAEQASKYYTYIVFMLKSHTEDVLKMIEDQRHTILPMLGKRKTEILLKKFKQRVLGNLDRYLAMLDLSTFTKCLQKNEIKTYLYKATKHVSGHVRDAFGEFDTWKYFLNRMPEEDRLKFVKNVLIDKNEIELLLNGQQRHEIGERIKSHQWYEFFPYDEAFSEFKNKMCQQSKPSERWGMLSTLILCAKSNIDNTKSLVKYVAENHINEPFKFKKEFVNTLLSNVPIHEFDIETWNYLNQLFQSMEVYVESKKRKMQLSLQAVILYNVLHNKPIPEIIQHKNTSYDFTHVLKTLNEAQRSKLFTYILGTVCSKIKTDNIVNEADFNETLHEIEYVLILLKDFNKKLNDYPLKKMWTTDMSCLYNVNKSWRKLMFEESLSLSLCEETCLNALKHKPQLLMCHDKQIYMLLTNNAVSLRRVLAKLRVYWPDSLARHWTEIYMQSLNKPTDHKAVIEGLFILMSQNQVNKFASEYVPENFKINWGLTDHTEVNIRKNIAKHLHVARPVVPLDTVLWYAKEDYLQFTVPSLNAILSNLSEFESRKHLPKLLEAPVSLSKFGLLVVSLKFETDEIIKIFTNVLNTTKNPSLKFVIFQRTYNKIREMKNSPAVKELWKLLSLILDDLSFEQKGNMFMKSYEFFTTLPDTHDNDSYLYKLLQCVPKVMESLDEDFVAEKLLVPVDTKFCANCCNHIESYACFVLFGDSEENQLVRFKRVLHPAMKEAFNCWQNNFYGTFYVQKQFNQLLDLLGWYFRVYFTLNKIRIPAILFAEIKTTLEQGLPEVKDYVRHTSWKVVTEYITLLKDNRSVSDAFKDAEMIWKDIHCKLSPSFGPKIVNFLKEDSERYSPTVFNLFADAFERSFEILGFRNNDFALETLKYMLDDQDFIPIYLVVSKIVAKYCANYDAKPYNKSLMSEILEKLKSNPSKIVKLEGETLGEKRRHFNKLVADAVASKHYELTPIDYTDSDIDNLLKIEIACKTRNVDYVIEVMKSKDMLYASTAIKKSTWLITDPQYANIINPEYLHTQLKPYMTTKAFNKLMLHIRLNLKDESRVEAFYDHYDDIRIKDKWLQNCSVPFIENSISHYVSLWLFKRLCKKSNHFLTCTSYVAGKRKNGAVYLTMLKSRTADILHIIEDKKAAHFISAIGKKRTEFLMKTCPQRILKNIKMYRWKIDLSVVARYMNKNEIAAFLCKNASDMGFCHDHKILIHFIKNMPEEERVKFIQKSFIDRTEMLFDKNEISFIDSSFRYYQWYEFFPFEIAFPKMNNLIRKENSPMGVYTESENDFQLCWESIILRKVLNDEPVPESIEKKCTFRSFKNFSKTLNMEQKNKLITYILTCMSARTKFEGFASESDFRDTLNKMESVLILLKNFNKTLSDYPFITKKIQDLNKIRQVNKWFVDMSCLYSVNKAWRKYMFEDSLSLSLCEETCLNALKHKPQLLSRHDKQIHTLRTNDAVSLRRVLAKLRVYWPDTLARHWTEAYMQHLNGPTGHKAIIKGLFILLSQDQVIELAKRYVPKNFQITWCLTDQTEINIQINIAKHLHLARPLVPLETVLWYAKGNFVQYAMQSHIAIWSALGEVDIRENLSKFYDAPVLVLKFVLNQAYLNLTTNEIINTFLKIWKCTKSAGIKSIILDRTLNATEKSYDTEIIKNELWKLLNVFIEDLSSEDENADIYKQLTNFKMFPYEKQPEYYMKISRYLASLPDWQRYKDEILYFSSQHMELLDDDFVLNLLLSPVENIFCSSNRLILDEEFQLERLKKVEPAFVKAFQNWYETNAYKKNFKRFLVIATLLFKDSNFFGKKMLIPAKLFAEIEFKMKNSFSLLENYKLFTSWKLITAYFKILKLCKESHVGEDDSNFSLLLSSIILQYLKDDIKEYGPMIHDMFAAALDKMCNMLFINDYLIIDILRHMLNDEGFVPAWLVVSKILPKRVHDEETKHAQSEIFQKLKSNVSISVQVQFNNDFRDYLDEECL